MANPAQKYRVCVIEDDPDVAFYMKTVLEKRADAQVVAVTDPSIALDTIAAFDPDVVITDIEMPGISGIDLLRELRGRHPGMPVVVMTAHVSVDYAVSALRAQADEFLTKPIASSELVAIVGRLAEEGRAKRAASQQQVVLAIGAHPDDVEIGAAGALLAHRAAGHDVAILTMSRGARGGPDDARAGEARQAAAIIGAELYLEDLEDTRISESDPTISAIRAVVEAVQPTIVYTHSIHDVHQDHRNTHRAVMVAARGIGSVFCYQSPSATVDFRPARFIAIDEHITAKLAAIGAFSSQVAVREYLEPDLIEATARYWSRFGSGRHAEAFEVVRDHATGPAMGWTSEEEAQQEATALEATVRENAADERAARQILEAGHAIT